MDPNPRRTPPASPAPASPRRPLALVAGFAGAALALALGLMAIAGPRTDLNPRSRLPDMVEGTAARPYVKRALVGLMVRAGDAVVPAGARAAFGRLVAATPLLRERLHWGSGHATWFALVFALHIAALVLFAFAFRRVLVAAIGAGEPAASLGGLAALALVPIHFGYQNFVYDFPGLALFALGLALLFERRWGAYYLLWPIGLLNKETYVLLLPVFAIVHYRTLPRRALALHLAAQLVSFVVIWGALAWVFRANRGTALEWHLARNFTAAVPLRQRLHDLAYWGFWVLAFLGWKSRPTLALATLVVGAVLFGTTLFFGFLGEYRDFYEAWPLVAALAAQTLLAFLARRTAGAAHPRSA